MTYEIENGSQHIRSTNQSKVINAAQILANLTKRPVPVMRVDRKTREIDLVIAPE